MLSLISIYSIITWNHQDSYIPFKIQWLLCLPSKMSRFKYLNKVEDSIYLTNPVFLKQKRYNKTKLRKVEAIILNTHTFIDWSFNVIQVLTEDLPHHRFSASSHLQQRMKSPCNIVQNRRAMTLHAILNFNDIRTRQNKIMFPKF